MGTEHRPLRSSSSPRPSLPGKSGHWDMEENEDSNDPTQWVDSRDSFYNVYLSAIPFIFLEYAAESFITLMPSGVVFPFGFLLFWAFYYTYYKPGFLENRLSNTEEWSFVSIPTVLLGVVVWFVKVTVVGAIHLILSQLGIGPKAGTNSQHQELPRPKAPATKPREFTYSGPAPLPADVQDALIILGAANVRDWNTIHSRYRELAKKYHPDLNPNDTGLGSRFMKYDRAYKRLAQVRKIYFT